MTDKELHLEAWASFCLFRLQMMAITKSVKAENHLTDMCEMLTMVMFNQGGIKGSDLREIQAEAEQKFQDLNK